MPVPRFIGDMSVLLRETGPPSARRWQPPPEVEAVLVGFAKNLARLSAADEHQGDLATQAIPTLVGLLQGNPAFVMASYVICVLIQLGLQELGPHSPIFQGWQGGEARRTRRGGRGGAANQDR